MLMRTDPFRDLDRMAQQVLGTVARPATVPIDAYRDGDEFLVHLDVPGVEADSINLTVEKNVLSVHAERQRTTGEKTELLVSERPQGVFSRQLFLGDSLDTDRIEASCSNGVLTLRLPIAEKAKPRRVSITNGDGHPQSIEAQAEERVPAGVGA